MKTTLGLGLVSIAIILVACGGEEPTEKQASTTNELGLGECVSQIAAPVGSPEWRAGLQACAASGGPAEEVPGEPIPNGGGAKRQCTSVSCTNGSCVCGAGPNAGAPCDGTKLSGDDACSVLCTC